MGTIKLGAMPRYTQTGELEIISKREYYLVIFLNKLNVFEALEDTGGEAHVFASIEWAGQVKKTRRIKRANLNETIYFGIPMDNDTKSEDAKLIDFLNDELSTKSEVIFNVWADTGKINLESLGSARVSLSVLHSSKF